MSIEFVKPIPLTDTILVRLGAIIDGDRFDIMCDELAFDISWFKEDGVCLVINNYIGTSFNYINQLKYVHQLQNLYFSLTGDRLQIITK